MRLLRLLTLVLFCSSAFARDWSLTENPSLERWFEQRVSQIEQRQSLHQYKTLDQWQAERNSIRGELFDMLGLNPLPPRTNLQVRVTGTLQHDEFTVEKLWIQTLPGLYVTASFYRPNKVDESLPAILYVCGHAKMKGPEGVSFGNKTGYQHHGAWFARNGYVCLTIDTLQLGEIEGIHHGTYRHNRWWWNSRGYTPAGVEAWNCIRALDYLESRSEVDSKRIGVTGRSGGGAYSWWIAALDDRISCAVPVAGIATLRNHVIDGCVEGHCDCMFFLNTYQWDFAKVAALVAPRPLLISNSDKDAIFPLDGVVEIHSQVRNIYKLYNKSEALGLQITEGPHRDTQELRIHAFRWMNRWLRNKESLVEKTAVKFFEPPLLRVFEDLPADEINTVIDQQFVATPGPFTASQRDAIVATPLPWLAKNQQLLASRCFAALDDVGSPANLKVTNMQSPIWGRIVRVKFGNNVPLSVDIIRPTGDKTKKTVLHVCSDVEWNDRDDLETQFARDLQRHLHAGNAVALFCPRGIGNAAWAGDAKKQIQIRRRFQLIGTTVDTMRVRDINMARRALLSYGISPDSLTLEGTGVNGWLSLFAAAMDSETTDIEVHPIGLSAAPEQLPVLLNLTRHFRPEELFALCSARVRITGPAPQELSQITETQQWKSAFGKD